MKNSLNMLPLVYRRRVVRRRCVRAWVLVSGIVTASLVVWYVSERSYFELLTSRLRVVQTEYSPVQSMEEAVNGVRKQLDELQTRETIALELAENQPVLTLVGVVSQAAARTGGQIGVAEMTLLRSSFLEKGQHPGKSKNVVTLQGKGLDNVAIAKFLAGLRDSGIFRTVELRSSGIQPTSLDQHRSYKVECLF